MDLTVACVGTRMPAWVAQGWQTYAGRMPAHLKLELLEVAVPGKVAPGQVSAAEAELLLARVPDRARRIALHGPAKPWSTEKLAQRLADWQLDGDPVWLFIGGADGLDSKLLETCQARWSFGPAVFPHMLVRVMVAEQLYRAWTILSHHPYHRANTT
jgi:23S rRNA (pseudouridine1915-N3)-methyltransferase